MQNQSTQNIIHSLAFLEGVIGQRIAQVFKQEPGTQPIPKELEVENDNSPLSRFISYYELNIEEYIILILALSPHIEANFLDRNILKHFPNGGDLPELGGAKISNTRFTMPTGETALFLLGGMSIADRIEVSKYFSPDHFFSRENILTLEQLKEGEPRMSGRLMLQQEYVDLLTTGVMSKPAFGPDFPAKLVTTKMEWKDLVLNPKTINSIYDIKIWLEHNAHLRHEWGMDNVVKPGYKALFHGPPGTGKTLTATLLGKQFEREVYRVDLSQVVSKYIGETEKNLEKIFTKAENKNWILFFDEADALFGKRSNVQSAHDKYANQEVSYLLQRVEDFPGLIILASNFKSLMDNAFLRRFNSIIHFPMPDMTERQELWKNAIPSPAKLAEDVNLQEISRKYEISGSAIVSAIQYASLQTIHKRSNLILRQDLLDGIKKEYEKEERIFS
jgi:hypothetical protein